MIQPTGLWIEAAATVISGCDELTKPQCLPVPGPLPSDKRNRSSSLRAIGDPPDLASSQSSRRLLQRRPMDL